MDSKENVCHNLDKASSKDVMSRFIDFFRDNNMLNQFLEIEHCQRVYKIYCSQDNFFVYRINPDPGIPPGFPGWITCMITHEGIVDYSTTGEVGGEDPSVQEWLDGITNGNFKYI